MKRIIKKTTALLITALLLLGIMPPEIIQANTQIPINTWDPLKITDNSGASGYSINLTWNKPLVADGTPKHEVIDHYGVYYRNASRAQAFPAQPNGGTVPGDPKSVNYNVPAPILDPGSLYVFRVEPVHFHNSYDNNGILTGQVKAPVTSGYTESQAIYMTDIRIEAGGMDNKMTVTWDYPRFNGVDIFPFYRIYYTPGGSLNTTVPNDPHIDVAVKDATVVGNKLQFTFEDDKLIQGIKYAVKVEPLIWDENGTRLIPVRGDASSAATTTITSNNVTYNLAYTRRSREYRTDDAAILLSLTITEEDDAHIKLNWDNRFPSINPTDKIEILVSNTEDFAITRLETTLLGNFALNMNDWLVDKPQSITYYKIRKYVKGSDVYIESVIAKYDPAYTDFSPYTPTIREIKPTVVPAVSLDIIWESFVRMPYNAEEEKTAVDNRYLDTNVLYDIWVTDNANNFDSMSKNEIVSTLNAANQLTPDRTTNPPTYTTKLQDYYSAIKDPDSGVIIGYEKKPLTDNKVYYLRIIARRPTDQTSNPAYGSCFIPPSKDIPTDPITISKPPLRIKTDSVGNEIIDDKSITIQWDLRWVEAYSSADKSWYPMIGVDGAGNIVSGGALKDIKNNNSGIKVLELNDPKYQMGDATVGYKANEKAIADALGVDASKLPSSMFRLMNLKNASYEVHVAEYDLINEAPYDGYEDYLAVLQLQENQNQWVSIKPTGDPEHPDFAVKSSQNPNGALKNNTAYIIFFRPFVESDKKRIAYVPNFVVGTTKDEKKPVSIKPTVPVLEAVSTTDTTLTVRWMYSPEFAYELAYSENLADYKDTGISIPWADIEISKKVKPENENEYMYFTIEGLFPDTIYHIWIRSSDINDQTTEPSEWSNPISMTTNDIQAPSPPRGLSPAAQEHVELFNKASGVTLVPIASDYMIIEWMRDTLDTNSDAAGIGGDTASAELLSHPDIATMFMVRFKDLIPNKPYYIRAKTVLTITKSGEGIVRQYNYVVQVSPDPDFTDKIEISVPALPDVASLDPVYTKRKESDWSITIHLYTSPSDSEFDGDKNPDQYPLPQQDFEVTYDSATDTLTFRFRTDQKDSSGANDNSVDQRFISKLVSSKAYTYTVDMSKYNNKTVANRSIVLPYSIMKAFDERKIQFEIKADNATVTITPGSLQTADVKGLSTLGKGSNVIFTLAQNPKGAPVLTDEVYASSPHKLTIQVKTTGKSLNLTNLAKQIKVDLKLDNRYTAIDQNINAYIADANTEGWERIASSYNSLAGQVSFNTYKPASYSAIAKKIAEGTPDMSADAAYSGDALLNITSKLDIKDLGTFSPREPVTANAFNNMIAGIARNKKSFKINDSMSPEDYNALGKSGWLVPGGLVPREAGINAIVSLYENKTKKVIKNYSSLKETPYPDIEKADEKYRKALLKAGDIGFLDGSPLADPKGNLTMGDLFYMIDIIMQDAGL